MKNILYAILASFILSQDVLGMRMVTGRTRRANTTPKQSTDNASNASPSNNGSIFGDDATDDNEAYQKLNNRINKTLDDIRKMKNDLAAIKEEEDSALITNNDLIKRLSEEKINLYLGINRENISSISKHIDLNIRVANDDITLENYEDLVDYILSFEPDISSNVVSRLVASSAERDIITKLKIALITEIDENNSVENILKRVLSTNFKEYQSKSKKTEREVFNEFIGIFTKPKIKEFLTSKKEDFLNYFSNKDAKEIQTKIKEIQTKINNRKSKILSNQSFMSSVESSFDTTKSIDAQIHSIISKHEYYKKRFYQTKNTVHKKEDQNVRASFFVWQDDYCYNLHLNSECQIGYVLKKDPIYPKNTKEEEWPMSSLMKSPFSKDAKDDKDDKDAKDKQWEKFREKSIKIYKQEINRKIGKVKNIRKLIVDSELLNEEALDEAKSTESVQSPIIPSARV